MKNLAGKRIVVTGGSGFLGRFVVERLAAADPAELFVPRSAVYDLVQAEAVRALYADTRPDLVIHLAAVVGGIGANMQNPGRYFYENLMMGVQLIEEGRRTGLSKFVALGTICAYPKFTPVPFREEDLWNGYPEETNAPYGLAKKMMLVQAQAYRAQYGMNVIFLLPVNLYGPHDNFDPVSSHVIPALVRKCVEARRAGAPAVEVWGDGSASREFLYVADAAEGIVLATARYNGEAPVNLGSGMEITIGDLARTVAAACRYDGEIVFDPGKPNGQPRRCLDTSRAREAFGFTASTGFAEGLARTVAWYEEQLPSD